MWSTSTPPSRSPRGSATLTRRYPSSSVKPSLPPSKNAHRTKTTQSGPGRCDTLWTTSSRQAGTAFLRETPCRQLLSSLPWCECRTKLPRQSRRASRRLSAPGRLRSTRGISKAAAGSTSTRRRRSSSTAPTKRQRTRCCKPWTRGGHKGCGRGRGRCGMRSTCCGNEEKIPCSMSPSPRQWSSSLDQTNSSKSFSSNQPRVDQPIGRVGR
mmetsp:Transcript_16409/g.35553  ORF Transcript_16409/g.35553 Transcript_16409/m.35553 type:complete len:211 (-) Transcript_16409:56-688(-)